MLNDQTEKKLMQNRAGRLFFQYEENQMKRLCDTSLYSLCTADLGSEIIFCFQSCLARLSRKFTKGNPLNSSRTCALTRSLEGPCLRTALQAGNRKHILNVLAHILHEYDSACGLHDWKA